MADDDPKVVLSALAGSFVERLASAKDEHELRAANADLSGTVSWALKQIPRLPGNERREFGQRANAIKQDIARAFDARLAEFAAEARKRELEGPPIDVTLPGRGVSPGRLHPISRVMNELVDAFTSLGFDVADGPEVELAEYNFDKLGFPPDHPATDMQDSFFVDAAARTLLRTHTSPTQVREMLRRKPPLAVVSPGAVYRRDDDVTHSPMFFQLEGFLVDEHVTFANLKGVLLRFAQRMFGEDMRVRLRPSYFPFVEPGGEIDFGCMICKRWTATTTTPAPCRVCKSSGWLEVGGCGMIHPVVFEHVGYDPERYTGFAFGMGVDRIAMLRYGIGDIRLLYENDIRFLSQL